MTSSVRSPQDAAVIRKSLGVVLATGVYGVTAGALAVAAGLSVLQADTVRARIPGGAVFDLADLFRDLSLEGHLAGFEAEHRFYEIGTPAGLADLEAGHLRTPTTPEVSFGDDPLRMMRAARFVAQLGLVPAPEVYAAMSDMAGSIAIVSAERVRDEMAALPGPERAVELLERLASEKQPILAAD